MSEIKKNRLLIIIMLIFLAAPLALLPVSAGEQYTEGELIYEIEDESIVIVGYFGNRQTVRLPEQIAGLPVSAIEKGAFTNSTVKELYIPETVMEIETGAFGANVKVIYGNGQTETAGTDAEASADTKELHSPEPVAPAVNGNGASDDTEEKKADMTEVSMNQPENTEGSEFSHSYSSGGSLDNQTAIDETEEFSMFEEDIDLSEPEEDGHISETDDIKTDEKTEEPEEADNNSDKENHSKKYYLPAAVVIAGICTVILKKGWKRI